jgi:hypothetical protein
MQIMIVCGQQSPADLSPLKSPVVCLPEHLPELDTRPNRDVARPLEPPRPAGTQKSTYYVSRLSRHPEIVTKSKTSTRWKNLRLL